LWCYILEKYAALLKELFMSIMKRQRHGVHDVRQKDIHTAELLVPEPCLIEVEIAIGKLKSYKSPGTGQIPVELIKAGGETLCSEIHKLICSI
jgi:hypothetical protein